MPSVPSLGERQVNSSTYTRGSWRRCFSQPLPHPTLACHPIQLPQPLVRIPLLGQVLPACFSPPAPTSIISLYLLCLLPSGLLSNPFLLSSGPLMSISYFWKHHSRCLQISSAVSAGVCSAQHARPRPGGAGNETETALSCPARCSAPGDHAGGFAATWVNPRLPHALTLQRDQKRLLATESLTAIY